ncbi:hypothetical protein GCM10009093_12050 [Brevundimonas terrae]|uniref:AraC family transcriptional regulator n=1 Tax=Brevundimonas terrae TaxID=363631 RepID=A0ABN0Y8G0_9CAUL
MTVDKDNRLFAKPMRLFHSLQNFLDAPHMQSVDIRAIQFDFWRDEGAPPSGEHFNVVHLNNHIKILCYGSP